MSDLHLEANGNLLVAPKPDERALIIAGDLDGLVHGRVRDSTLIVKDWIVATAQLWAPKEVILVLGNHDFYESSLTETLEVADDLRHRFAPNLHVLECSSVTIDGQRFVGTTLWYRVPRDINWSDFKYVRDLLWTDPGLAQVRWLDTNLQKGDVLITHMLPSPLCIAPQWVGSYFNQYFVHDIGPLIEEREPKLCIFGHTHTSTDRLIGSTRVISNPAGFLRHTENPKFDINFTIEV